MTHGPSFLWFAWHPVRTLDRGWRWLCFVHRRRYYVGLSGQSSRAGWEYARRPFDWGH